MRITENNKETESHQLSGGTDLIYYSRLVCLPLEPMVDEMVQIKRGETGVFGHINII